MTTQNIHEPRRDASNPGQEVWHLEDEIDLRQYVELLLKWWREITLVTVAAVICTFAVTLLMDLSTPPTYKAAATVAIARVKSDITFDDRYRTLSEEELQQLRGDARRSALLGLVQNSAVAEAVIEDLGADLTADEQNPALLLDQVEATLVTSSDGRTDSDLIRISVETDSPARSALIANAWANHYVRHVNTLYGSVPPELMASVNNDLAEASVTYDEAQRALESFISDDNSQQLERLISEKEAVIESIQAGKQSALQSLIDKELEARQQIAAAYINALALNRLLGFEKEQEAKRQVISAYIDSEVEARITAFMQDREARQEIYERLTEAELDSVLAVFDQQVQDQLSQISRQYEEKQRLEMLLGSAQTLREQVVAGGDPAADSNRLAVTLLKTQIFSATATLPSSLQLSMSASTQPVTAAEQEADLDALVGAVEQRLALLNTEISNTSSRLAAGEGYQLLETLSPESLAVTTSLEDSLGGQTETDKALTTLKDAIMARYPDLYEIGRIAETGQQLATDTELFGEIRSLYPDLFKLDELASLAEGDKDNNPLSGLGRSEASQLLLFQNLGDWATYDAAAAEVDSTLTSLETELQGLRSQLEAQMARKQHLTHQRDLSWTTFTTLSNKNIELSLSNTAANSEVRFAAPAIPPAEPVDESSLLMITTLAGVIALMFAVFAVFLLNFMEITPFLRRRQPT